MRQFIIEIVVGYFIMTMFTFIPIIAGIMVYHGLNGKENKKIERLSVDLVCGGSIVGIYWFLQTAEYLLYLKNNPITPEKISRILELF